MFENYTHNRAAMLCFGGWGLQTMFHLLPRLQFNQEQRSARGLAGPQLSQITGFALLAPDPLVDSLGQVHFSLYRPAPGPDLPPFFIEKLLARQAEAAPQASLRGGRGGERPLPADLLTHAEKRALSLLQAAEPVLQRLPLEPHAGQNGSGRRFPPLGGPPPSPPRRASRAEHFNAALTHADPIAQALQVHLIDPLRQDSLVPGDPFVQTTLYVVVPLFEPLASALLWPVLAQLVANLGQRHLFQIVGIFATGSYAKDQSRALEEAAAYAALKEIEALTGLGSDRKGQAALAAWMDSTFGPARGDHWSALRHQVGVRLFDQIYLVDREKSNQGLAQDSHELAVLVGNALEALIVADGNQFIQDQLGAGARILEDQPYSLLGAANDYVPLASILEAASQQEEKRLARELILAEHPMAPGGEPQPPLPFPTLTDLGVAPAQALAQLVVRFPDLFRDEVPTAIHDLVVSPHFLLSPGLAAELRLHRPAQWELAFAGHLREVREHFDLVVDPDAAWGVDSFDGEGRPLPGTEDQLLPSVMVQIQELTLDVLASTPGGLSIARRQVQRWLDQAEEERQLLRRQSAPGMRRLQQAQRTLAGREWQRRYRPLASKHPTFWGIALRAALATGMVILFAAGYMHYSGYGWRIDQDGMLLIGFVIGALLAGSMALRRYSRQMEALRRERLALAQTELTALLQDRAREGLLRIYERLSDMLQRTLRTLHDTADQVQEWCTTEEMPAVPPIGVQAVYLRRAHLDQALWDHCRGFLRSRQDQRGQRGEERVKELWGSIQWRREMRRLLNGTAAIGQGQNGYLDRPRTVAELLQQTISAAVAPVTVRAAHPARVQLLRDLARGFNLEHLLWRNAHVGQRSPWGAAGEWSQRASADAYTLDRALVAAELRTCLESNWNRAKPAANYDIADRMLVTGVEIDFAAVSGDPDSDLSEAALTDFRVARLVTWDPFSITFVRTVHGLGLDDVENIGRYREALRTLSSSAWSLVTLTERTGTKLYEISRPGAGVVSGVRAQPALQPISDSQAALNR